MNDIIGNTKIYQILNSKNSEFISVIDDLIPIVSDRLESQVSTLFPEFTLHNIQHSKRVIEYIADIVEDIESFNEFELALMILAALLHDLGMALGKDEITKIENNEYFYDNIIDYNGYLKLYGDKATQEIVRRYHADISSKIISEHNINSRFILKDPSGVSYLDDLQLLCQSHTRNLHWIGENLLEHNVKGVYDYNLRFISYILRIADLLDIDKSRTPFELYKLIIPEGKSDDEWKQHFIVTNTKKIEMNKNTGNRNVVFYGKSKNIKIHRKLLSYINWINDELKNFIKYCENYSDERYKNNLLDQVVNKIETEGFTVSDYRLLLDFKSITELLMGENIYGDKKLGLREIVQNSIDACLVRNEIENVSGLSYEAKIEIIVIEKENKFIIKDNGIGMSEEIVKNYFLNIGKSYYKSEMFKLNNYNYKPIGSFGIGFLACFMLSEDVRIDTRYYNLSSKHTILIEKGDEYIGFNSVDDVSFSGTSIELNLSQVLENFDGDIDNVIRFIKLFFVNDDFKFTVLNDGNSKEIENYIKNKMETEKNVIIDDVSKYLEDSTGFFKIKNKHNFINGIKDLNIYSENIFYFNEIGLCDEDIDLKTIVNNEKNNIKFLHLPLYDNSNSEKFEEILEILDDDIDATIAKLDPDDHVYIFFSISDQDDIQDCDTDNDYKTFIYNELQLQDVFDRMGKEYYCPIIKVVEQNVLANDSFSMLEEFKKYNYYYTYLGMKGKDLYLRNILIKNYNFSNQVIANTIDLIDFAININKKDILPSISRNDLLPQSDNIVSNSINIAFHLSALVNFNLNIEEQTLLKKYIKLKLLVNENFVKIDVLKKYLE